jgi:hypothetical protein
LFKALHDSWENFNDNTGLPARAARVCTPIGYTSSQPSAVEVEVEGEVEVVVEVAVGAGWVEVVVHGAVTGGMATRVVFVFDLLFVFPSVAPIPSARVCASAAVSSFAAVSRINTAGQDLSKKYTVTELPSIRLSEDRNTQELKELRYDSMRICEDDSELPTAAFSCQRFPGTTTRFVKFK